MPHKDPAARAAYMAEWRRRRFETAPLLVCACGCGGTLSQYTATGRPRKYLYGHRKPLPEGHQPRRVRLAKRVPCACKCGSTLISRDKHGNRRRYIYGHSPTKVYPWAPAPVGSGPLSRQQQYKWNKKMAVLRHYGGDPPKCACCNESHVEFLAIDHVDGGGNEHRRRIGSNGGASFYAWLIRRGLPDGFRVLCHNCNMAWGLLGYCPHKGPQKG